MRVFGLIRLFVQFVIYAKLHPPHKHNRYGIYYQNGEWTVADEYCTQFDGWMPYHEESDRQLGVALQKFIAWTTEI